MRRIRRTCVVMAAMLAIGLAWASPASAVEAGQFCSPLGARAMAASNNRPLVCADNNGIRWVYADQTPTTAPPATSPPTTSRPTSTNTLVPQASGTVDAGEFCANARSGEVTTARNGRTVVCLFDPDSNRYHWTYVQLATETPATTAAVLVDSRALARTGTSSDGLAQAAAGALVVGLVLYLLALPQRRRSD